MNPWDDATTVEDLLILLEAECPVSIVTDALAKKQMTTEEKERLISDLEYISQEARNAIASIKRGSTNESTHSYMSAILLVDNLCISRTLVHISTDRLAN